MGPPPLRGYGWTYKPDPAPMVDLRLGRIVLGLAIVGAGAWAVTWVLSRLAS